MIYGLLIGLIVSSLIVFLSNSTHPVDTTAEAHTKSTVRMITFTSFVSSASALIGLLIRGA